MQLIVLSWTIVSFNLNVHCLNDEIMILRVHIYLTKYLNLII